MTDSEGDGENEEPTGDKMPSKRKGTLSCNRSKRNKWRFTSNFDCGRNIPIMAFPTYIPGGERASLFPRIETLLNSFGINGRACLKRAVCEVQEVPLKNGFGILGEVLTLFLR